LDNYKQENYQPVVMPIEEIIRQKGAVPHNIMFGDTNHGDNSIARFLARPETMKALAETGVTHLCMEAPVGCQNLVDSYTAGSMTRAQFLDRLTEDFALFHGTPKDQRERRELIADTIDNAKKFGIKTHFVDGGEGVQIDQSPFRKAFDNAIVDYMDKNNLKTYEDFIVYREDKKQVANLVNYVDKEVRKQFPDIPAETNVIQKYEDEMLDARLKADKSVAARINEIGSDGKVAIFYGAEHGMKNKDDLNEHLQGGALTIVLQGKDKDWSAQAPGDKPDLVHDVKTGITTADSENPVMADLERAPTLLASQNTPGTPAFGTSYKH
jgi:hypothetical protein